MKTSIKTFCPAFPGFYNSYFDLDLDQAIDNINGSRENKGLTRISSDLIEYNFDTFTKLVSEQFCEDIEQALSDFDAAIKYQSVVSPKFYNFSTDSINCEIAFDLDKVLTYIQANIIDFEEYISKKYTSCSGFISSHSSEFSDWLDPENKEYFLKGSHKAGAVLEFILKNEEFDVVFTDTHDKVSEFSDESITNYDELCELVTDEDKSELYIEPLLEKIKNSNGRV